MKYQVGERVNGMINNITDLGIFLTLPHRHTGLIHYSDFGDNWLRERNRYQKGQELHVVIVHNRKGKLGLSLKRVNDPELVDPKNQFSKTKEADFAEVLNDTARDAHKEIDKLKKVLNKN